MRETKNLSKPLGVERKMKTNTYTSHMHTHTVISPLHSVLNFSMQLLSFVYTNSENTPLSTYYIKHKPATTVSVYSGLVIIVISNGRKGAAEGVVVGETRLAAVHGDPG